MRIFFDARYIEPRAPGGISRFSRELAHAVYAAAPNTTFLVSDDEQTAELPHDALIHRIHPPTSWREPFTALVLNRAKPDVVFSPMQTIGSLGRRFPLLLTVHDTIYYRHPTPPARFNPLIRFGWRMFFLAAWPQRLLLNRATAVVTVSESSAVQLREMRLTDRPIHVVPNAAIADDGALPIQASPAATAPRELIYMGSFLPYKNVETLATAMSQLPDHRLHLLSRIDDSTRARLQSLSDRPGQLIFHNGVTDSEYFSMLSSGMVLVTASKDEGYGLPVMEAVIHNAPAVISDLPVFREIVADAVLYADPASADSFAAAIRSLDDPATRARLANARAALLPPTWADSAARLIEICRVAVHNQR